MGFNKFGILHIHTAEKSARVPEWHHKHLTRTLHANRFEHRGSGLTVMHAILNLVDPGAIAATGNTDTLRQIADYRALLVESRKSGDSTSEKMTTSSPVIVLMS